MLKAIRQFGSWEPQEMAAIEANVDAGQCVLDVGANVGYHALLLSRRVGPSGRVIAFEPDPLNFELLRTNLRINNVTNVLPINAAASDRRGRLEFTRDDYNAGDHRSYRRPGANPERLISVQAVRIDDLRIEADVSFVLTDTQAFDHRVIRGMRRLIRRCRPRMLVEFWIPGLRELGDDPAEVIEFYRSLGYQVSILGTACRTMQLQLTSFARQRNPRTAM